MRATQRVLLALLAVSTFGGLAPQAYADDATRLPTCDENNPLCTEPVFHQGPSGYYIGHDEPSLVLLDARRGAGNDVTYRIVLPREPTTQPTQDATNGVNWDFELRAAYWFGMILCDTQSAPEFQHDTCAPDSDRNIHTSIDPASPKYIGKAPGNAFMEVQFYPPGWVPQFTGFGCPGLKWCVSLTIDSLDFNQNTGQDNNAACLGSVGREPVNWAYLTLNGTPHAPPDPVSLVTNPDTGNPNPATDLQMNPGDELTMHMHDTLEGVQVVVQDRTTGQTGSMTASVANGFQQVDFDPAAATCTETPYAFHPEFASSTVNTRSSWAAHGYNVGTSDEIGHFEWCDTVNPDFTCASSSTDPGGPDGDEFPCFPASFSSLVPVSGCLDIVGDAPDFDGPSYQPGTWPGSSGQAANRRRQPTPITFSTSFGNGQSYRDVAFEADTARIESRVDSGGACDTTTGAGCTVIPPAANFYPQYSTTMLRGHCFWQFGGPNYPGTVMNFGTPAEEYGTLFGRPYPFPAGPATRFNVYRNDLGTNPCRY